MAEVKFPAQEAVEHVGATMRFMRQTAERWLATTEDAIRALGAWRPTPEGTPPNLQPQNVVAMAQPDIAPPDPTLLGEVGDLAAPAYEDLRALVDAFEPYDPGEFNPTSPLPNIPQPPAPIDTSGAPVRPTLNEVALPPEPDMTLPVPEPLDTITVPGIPTITVPTFDVGQIPVFSTDPPDLALNWQSGTYTPLAVTELAATIRAMLAGDYGMPKPVQDALWAASVDRARAAERQAVETALDDWAARGFEMPPGMLAGQVQAARDAATLAAQAASREVFTQAAQWQIENLRTAVAQGIALESMWSQHWNQIEQRTLEAARVMVELTKDQFNLVVTAFNTQVARVQMLREVFEASLRAELAKLEILKAELEAAQLRGTLNEQKVRIYATRLEGVKTLAAVFSARLDGAKIRADLERSKLDGYKTDVDAWGEKLRAEKSRFDAYDSQVRGEATKAQAYEAEARAYAARVQAASDRNAARNRVAEMQLRAVEASVQKFLGLLQGAVAHVSARRDAIGARAQAYSADAQRYAEQLRYATAGQDVQIRAQEASVRNNMAYFDTVSRQFDSRQARLIQASLALKDALTAAGQMSAQMAAGAMSAIHAQASISGSGSSSIGYSESHDYKYNMTPDAPE